MAAIPTIDFGNRASKLCETLAITNQVANTTVVYKAVPVPSWAEHATVVIGKLLMAGTTPLFDFKLYGYDVEGNAGAAPDDGFLYDLGGWDGITQKTAAASTYTVVDVGDDIIADDTGSATASDFYGVRSSLPRWLVYSYTTDGTSDDEDYSGTISIYFRH